MMCAKDLDTYTYFSFVEPWSYDDSLKYFNRYQKLANGKRKDDIYFHRELLAYSKEYRYIELITISSHSQKLEELEPTIEGPVMFPEFQDPE